MVMTPTNLCVAVQYFVKQETVIAMLETVRRMAGGRGATLLLMQDGIEGARNAEELAALHEVCAISVEDWAQANRAHFAQIVTHRQIRNLGTCATTRAIIDMGFSFSDWVIFAEDDVLFCDTALDWFMPSINSDIFAQEDVWAIAGESKAFDSRGKIVTPTRFKEDLSRANSLDLMSRHVLFDFLPSSCFATTLVKWAIFGETRGQPNGDRDVNLRCRAEKRRSLWPVIARCCDEGMHHPLGYSMMVRKGDISAIAEKTVYLTADDLEPVKTDFKTLEKHLNSLFTEWKDSQNGAST